MSHDFQHPDYQTGVKCFNTFFFFFFLFFDNCIDKWMLMCELKLHLTTVVHSSCILCFFHMLFSWYPILNS